MNTLMIAILFNSLLFGLGGVFLYYYLPDVNATSVGVAIVAFICGVLISIRVGRLGTNKTSKGGGNDR